MIFTFKPGDIVVYKETEDEIGIHDFSMAFKDFAEKKKAQLRLHRFEVIKIYNDKFDKDGFPCFRLRRLDTRGHMIEDWTQQVFVLAEKVK
jgi:hypothetical protein